MKAHNSHKYMQENPTTSSDQKREYPKYQLTEKLDAITDRIKLMNAEEVAE
jgi:hypothetical protein